MLPILNMLCQMSQGLAVQATRVWRPHPGHTGDSLFEVWERTRLAGCANRHIARKRAAFQTSAAQRLLAHHRGQVHVPVVRHMTQAEVGQPRPVRLATEEIRGQYIKHVKEAMYHGEYEFLKPGDKSMREIIIPEHVVVSGHPPKPRIAIRGDLTKDPVKALMERRHWRT